MRRRGFGTNFHKVYASDPETYHTFSAAEHFSKELSNRIGSLLTKGILLDVAAGTCHKSDLLSQSFEKVYALDNSQPLLGFAKQKYRSNKKLHFLLSSASAIPLLDESVDSVISTWGSFPLTPSVQEMKRVLKRGGVIVRIGAVAKDDFTRLFPAFDINRINRINRTFERLGFTIERQKVEIRFRSLAEAKRILTEVTGARPMDIDRSTYEHEVAVCYYRKQ